MTLRNKLLCILILLTPVLGFSFKIVWETQLENIAKNYAEKKYKRDFTIEGSTYGGMGIRLGEYKSTGWFSSEKIGECVVYIGNVVSGVNRTNVNPDVENIAGNLNVYRDTCGEMIISRKVRDYVQKATVDKFYDEKDINFGIDVRYNTLPDEDNLKKIERANDKIFNENSNWNLSAEEWLKKFSSVLKIERVFVNIFNTPKSAENIAKIMNMAFELNKYLYSLTETRIIRSMSIYSYKNSYKNLKSKNRTIIAEDVPRTKDYPKGIKWNNNVMFINGGYINKFIPIKKSNIFEFVFITNSKRNARKPIKETKYYQPVKQLLEK